MYLPTASVPSLPPPGAPMVAPMRKPSLAKDILIGVAIAAVVLGLFAAGKYFVFGDKPGPKSGKAKAAATGTIALAVGGKGPATVYVNGEEEGVVEGDSLTLTVDAGKYELKVVRAGHPPCEQRISVDAKEVKVVSCPFTDPPTRGQLVLAGIEKDHVVFVDDEEISREAAREPIQLVPDIPHHVQVRKGDKVVLELDGLSVSSGKVVRKAIGADGLARQPAPASSVGYLLADTTPPARVLVDGKDTGLTTPVTARDKIPLAPGKHAVTFVVGAEQFKTDVTIEPGKDKNLRRDLPIKK
jgi:hypothetical protein